MDKTIQYVINFMLSIIIILSMIYFITNSSKDLPNDVEISEHKEIINGNNLIIVWRTNYETDANLKYKNGTDIRMEIETKFKNTHNIILKNLSGLIEYNISSCTRDGLCGELLRNTVNI